MMKMKLLEKSLTENLLLQLNVTKGGELLFLSFGCQHIKLSFNQNKPLVSIETKKKVQQ